MLDKADIMLKMVEGELDEGVKVAFYINLSTYYEK
jgi:hypothetical protein